MNFASKALKAREKDGDLIGRTNCAHFRMCDFIYTEFRCSSRFSIQSESVVDHCANVEKKSVRRPHFKRSEICQLQIDLENTISSCFEVRREKRIMWLKLQTNQSNNGSAQLKTYAIRVYVLSSGSETSTAANISVRLSLYT